MEKKTSIWVSLLIVMGILLLITNSCTKEEVTNPIVVSDQIFYEQLGYTLIKSYRDIYNQNLAGKPTGTQNITSTGPMGGSVTITGSDSYDKTHNITTTDLTFTMSNVQNTYSKSSASGNTTATTQITITGATTYFGSFSDTYSSLNHQSSNLHIVGSVTYAGTERKIDASGLVTINCSSTTSVSIFGNTVSW
jgi:hypothetical protein